MSNIANQISNPLKTLFRCGWELLFDIKHIGNNTFVITSTNFFFFVSKKRYNPHELPAKYVDCNCIESKANENKNRLDN